MMDYDEGLVTKAIATDRNFRRLLEKHKNLNTVVDQANEGELTMTDIELEILKKEKLLCKDQMVLILSAYGGQQAVA